MGDRCSPVAHHKSSAESVPGLAGLGGFGGLGRSYGPYGPHAQARSVSRQSLLDLVGCRLGVGRNQRQHQRYFSSSRDSLAASYVNRTATASELDLSRKARRRELRGRLKLPAAVTSMAGSGADARSMGGMAPHGPAMGSGTALLPLLPRGSVAHAGQGYGGIQHRGRGSAACGAAGTRGPGRPHPGPSWSFVFDPAGRLCYYWSVVVSLAFLYNFWVIIYRFAFAEINRETIVIWFCLDYLADFLYVADIVFHFRTGYLEDGVLQTDAGKLRQHYMNSTTFYIDCLCLLPLDFLYLSIGFNSVLRGFRLVKIYRFWAFMDRTERHTNYPNLFRSCSLIHYLLVIFHWNGCLYHIVYKNNGFGSKNWVFGDHDSADVAKQYLQSYYWCTLALTTIGDLPRPRSKGEYMFVIGQLLFGLLLFATVLGHVANIVTSVSMARKEFQGESSPTVAPAIAGVGRPARRGCVERLAGCPPARRQAPCAAPTTRADDADGHRKIKHSTLAALWSYFCFGLFINGCIFDPDGGLERYEAERRSGIPMQSPCEGAVRNAEGPGDPAGRRGRSRAR
ncbi:hypothetical protein ONE63_006331 [Megalurothrips usitatus]|uniref:Ion transport domain-containing protein n=1 Tax=Megalurothrips usitatus TaxID=439358 RepID=A0AAV7XTP6_9NEOP|nr:hypothetical protein ONE63_006331 [Megalurothrips usitatus]